MKIRDEVGRAARGSAPVAIQCCISLLYCPLYILCLSLLCPLMPQVSATQCISDFGFRRSMRQRIHRIGQVRPGVVAGVCGVGTKGLDRPWLRAVRRGGEDCKWDARSFRAISISAINSRPRTTAFAGRAGRWPRRVGRTGTDHSIHTSASDSSGPQACRSVASPPRPDLHRNARPAHGPPRWIPLWEGRGHDSATPGSCPATSPR